MPAPFLFDLVVATVARTDPLDRLLASLERQSHPGFRVVVVDQNGDDRLAEVLAAHPRLELVRLRSAPGLSRARNAALDRLAGDVVAFPDDDCAYPQDLLARVAERLEGDPELDGVSGRTADAGGLSAGRWSREPGLVDADTVWHRVNSAALFLRRGLVARVGPFDERLGLGGPGPWSSGEEVDYVIRGVRAGARILFDPALVVLHAQAQGDGRELARLGRRDGASVGYLLRKHRYPARSVARALVRPAGGVALAAARRDLAGARFHAATLRGRVAGYLRSPTS